MSVDVRTHMTRGHGRKKSPDVSQQGPVLPTANSPVSSNALAVVCCARARAYWLSQPWHWADCGGHADHPRPHRHNMGFGNEILSGFLSFYSLGWRARAGRKRNTGNGLAELIVSANSQYCTRDPSNILGTVNGFLISRVTERNEGL